MRRTRPRQLPLVFADSSSEGGDVGPSDESEGRAYLLHKTRARKTSGLDAPAGRRDEGLLERVASESNLAQALLHVLRNRGAPGEDGKSVEEVVAKSPRLLPRLRHELQEGRYRPGKIRRVWIPKPGGGRRPLGIPNVVDRWAQQAVLQILEPVFEPIFHDSSHGFRAHRGAGTALADVKEHLESGHRWIVSVDIASFFDSVNHQRLLSRMSRHVSDGRVLQLVHQMLKAKVVFPDGTQVSSKEGTPQGGPLSPLLSNVVLDELDWELQRRGLRFVRYADDFQVFVRSERSGRRVMSAVTRFLERRLRLRVNVSKTVVSVPWQTHFLGFCFRIRPDGTVGVKYSRRTLRRLATQIVARTPRSWGQSLESLLESLNQYLKGWMAYYRLGTEEVLGGLRQTDAHIRRRLRAILVRRKGRRPRFLFRHLRQRGVSSGPAASVAWKGGGPWWKSAQYGTHMAYRNAWFADRLLSLNTEWQRHHPAEEVSGQQLLFGS